MKNNIHSRNGRIRNGRAMQLLFAGDARHSWWQRRATNEYGRVIKEEPNMNGRV